MRRGIVAISVIAAGLATAGFAEYELWIPAIICIAYDVFVLWANSRKKPRRAIRGGKNEHSRIPDSYSTTITIGTQAKIDTPAGKALMPIHYEL